MAATERHTSAPAASSEAGQVSHPSNGTAAATSQQQHSVVVPAAEAPTPNPGWRGSRRMVIFVLTLSFFSDAFMWGVPLSVLPFSLTERVHVKPEDVQRIVSQALSIFSAAGVIACPILGIVADRYGSRKVPFIVGLVCLLAATVLLATATSVAQVMIARLLQGLSAASVWVAGLAMLQDAVGGNELGSALGTCFAWVTLGELISPPLGGIIYEKLGYWPVWNVCSILIIFDLIARLLLREPKVPKYGAIKYEQPATYGSILDGDQARSVQRISQNGSHSETQPLLPHTNGVDVQQPYVPVPDTWFERIWPIAKLHKTARFNAALANGFAQAFVVSAIESTMPLHVHRLFGFDSLTAGLLFLPLVLPGVILGPILGRIADRHGGRYVVLRGFLFLAPGLAFFRVPGSKWFDDLFPASWTERPIYNTFPYLSPSVALFSVLLLVAGLGYPAISSPSLLESSQAVEDYQIEHGEDAFGPNGPWASMYAVSNIVFFAGLTVGPICGSLVDVIGFGNMSLILALFCVVMSFNCMLFLPKVRPTPTPRSRQGTFASH
ncbi:hypothetical protein OC861_005406 [Tilletia horrida]|nr:hypothetical protein OC861_005406 [Tilletia horrida]